MDDQNFPPEAIEPVPDSYQAPQVERVLTADDLAREIQYAGSVSVNG